MADIEFYQDDAEDPLGDGDDILFGGDYEQGQEDLLTPLQRLEQYVNNDNIYTRQMVARGLLDTLRQVAETGDDITKLLQIMIQLSEDPEPTVRSELMEQVPHIAMFCQENRHITPLKDTVPMYLMPMVVRYLMDTNGQVGDTWCHLDTNGQVRKTSQAALLVLLEQELVEREDVEEQVCPVILELTGPHSIDEHRTEAVALMSKMTPLVGSDMAERLFLPRFVVLCTDPLFHIRKVCAANFGEMCSVVGTAATEKHLLPKFHYLCEDGVWNVRKACAECFTAVSCACSQECRKKELAGLFINLLCDQSRWVRMAAFQALGPFISTFADPSITGLYFNEDGVLSVGQVAPQKNNTKSPTTEEANNNKSDGEKKGEEGNPEGTKEGDKEQEVKTPEIPNNTIQHQEQQIGSNSNNARTSTNDTDSVQDSRQVTESVSDKSGSTAEEAIDNSQNDILSIEDYINNLAMEIEASSLSEENGSGDGIDKHNDVLSVEEKRAEKWKQSHPSVPQSSDPDSDDVINACDTPSEQGFQSQESTTSASGATHIHLDNMAAFSSFNYWRTPLPQLDLHLDIVEGKATNIHVTAKVVDPVQHKVFSSKMDVEVDSSPTPSSSGDGDLELSDEGEVKIHTASVNLVSAEEPEETDYIGSMHVIGQNLNESTMAVINGVVQGTVDVNSPSGMYGGEGGVPSFTHTFSGMEMAHRGSTSSTGNTITKLQDVIPQILLDNYLSMTDAAQAQTVDSEIARHCAYSFPAVAYTLGREHWPCLKDLYDQLSQNIQWKVRRTLAFSIHELATIMGPEVTEKDLVPVFDGFLKDLDEVRVGVLTHLADFLKLLNPSTRSMYLPKVAEFLTTDNSRNWRFREELGQQLVSLCELFSCDELSRHILPIALTLAEDRVAEVRSIALKDLAVILRCFNESGEENVSQSFLATALDKFAHSDKWYRRQTYAHLCYHILQENSCSAEQFAISWMPALLSLAKDPIPNVRLALGKALSQFVIPVDYFTSYTNPHHQLLLETIQAMKADADRDVRGFVSMPPQTEIEHLDTLYF
ncbi:serine/threonine-protein phosphatase 4 regulatory subunit 1-like isoform X1 [Lingula anatina]|uniref:Serine/threonine-protein phosphatase 4 regulatory subunit 1-like isoform X1 n=1 Tax=Lingula anatina TaxID=7574 RepID=A0A1S3I011_LINAN|nr:serine/threonine-protein phosphatase 4 regulatory subunit 1-like isoform X1 [Lingula anatina]|eukprot:XP_013391161.1 serine/threonine-protein phosphatase 4 regulatory subunit 1-like isoform X1 [Lingula anatina]